jgi:integral membrane protein
MRPDPRPVLAPAGRLFAVAAFIEAATWAGLLVGMYLKYVSGTTDAGVWWFGRLHGAAFLLYVGVAIFAGARLRWPMLALLVALLAALPPLLTLPVESWFRRRGLLSTRGDAAQPRHPG